MKNILSIAIMALIPSLAFSWDGVNSGKINTIEVTAGENFGFRISLVGGAALCGTEHRWAYINQSASNYQTYVAVLLAAKMAEKSVSVFTVKRGANGYCEIGHISVQ